MYDDRKLIHGIFILLYAAYFVINYTHHIPTQLIHVRMVQASHPIESETKEQKEMLAEISRTLTIGPVDGNQSVPNQQDDKDDDDEDDDMTPKRRNMQKTTA